MKPFLSYCILAKESLLQFALFFLMLIPVFCNAQLNDTLKEIVEDGYIERMDQYIGAKASMNNAVETFSLRNNTGTKIELYPNTETYTHFGFNYRFISGGFSISPNFLPGNGDDETKGKTKDFSLGIELIFRHFLQTFRYASVRGYYLNNTKDYRTNWQTGDPYIIFKDLKYTGFEGASGYSFNPRFSLRALTSQTDRQLKSAGSFIILSKYRYYIMNDKSDASPTHSTQRSDNIEINIGIGYNYVFVIRTYFYASLGLTPYIGYLHSRIKTDSYTSVTYGNQNNRILGWDSRFALGYNGRRIFAGCTMNIGAESYRQEKTPVVNDGIQLTYQIFIGYRFNPFKIMQKQVDFMEIQMEEHMPKKKANKRNKV